MLTFRSSSEPKITNVTLLGHNSELGFVTGHFTGRVDQSAYCVRVFLCPNEMIFNLESI